MEEATVQLLTRRLERLERDNRRLKLGGAVVVVGLAALALMGQVVPGQLPKVVEAEQFVLRDARGQVSALLSAEPFLKGLTVFDEGGKKRAALELIAGSPRLSLADANGKERVALELTGEVSRLALSDLNRRHGVILTLAGADAMSGLMLADQGRKTRVRLVLEPGGAPRLELADQNQTPRAILGPSELHDPSLLLLDEEGTIVWKAP